VPNVDMEGLSGVTPVKFDFHARRMASSLTSTCAIPSTPAGTSNCRVSTPYLPSY
jgi:hypothetical protein